MNEYKNILLRPSSTIEEALEIINRGSMRIALVVKDNKLLGVVSDADIRRAMLNHVELHDSVEKIYNKNPFVCYADDTKEEIISKAVERNIYEIPIVDHHNNLVGFQTLTHLLKGSSYTNKVVIMAGGLGTRLHPLTQKTPKPLLKVGDKPILETIILNFKKYGFVNFILSVSYKSEMIENYFGDGTEWGVHIKYIHEEKRMGTAGALSLMREELTEPFFVMNGDLLTNVNFENMLQYHHFQKATGTMGVREYDFQVPYGVVNIENGSITSIEEKPVQKFFVSGGIYIFNPEAVDKVPEDQYFDMPTLFELLIAEQETTVSFPIREYWLDIGRMEEFERANSEYHKVF